MKELYGQGRMLKMANNMRDVIVDGLNARDLITNRPDGLPWDFNDDNKRKRAMKMLKDQQPTLLVGSPMCRAFSLLQGLNRKK